MSIVQREAPGFDPRLVRWGGYALAIAAVVAGVAALLVRTAPTALAAIALAAGSVGVAGAAPELFEVTGRGKARGLNPLFLFPAGLVFICGVTNDFIDVFTLLGAALVGAAAGAGLGALRMSRPGLAGPMQLLILLALCGAALGYGGTALVDVRFDTSAPQTIRTTVSSMYVSHGKSTSYQLRLPPWGPRTAPSTVSVSSSLYGRLSPGDPVCIDLHPGAVGVPWFELHACPIPA